MRTKRILSLYVAAMVLLSSLFFCVSSAGAASGASFTPRLTEPAKTNQYYFDADYNLFYKYGYGMPNCTAYAYAGFHEDFIRNKITLIGCPKLDEGDYSEKLTEIIRQNEIKSVTVVRMEVPCCGGLELAAKRALQNSGKFIPWQVVTISTDGRLLEN